VYVQYAARNSPLYGIEALPGASTLGSGRMLNLWRRGIGGRINARGKLRTTGPAMTVPKEITDLIQGSGNNFHAKVARWLMENKWHVVISPYYMDQTQSKAREIDLVAEKLWPLTNLFGSPVDNIAVRLFIECKFVASDAVFWFADKDREAALELVCANAPFRTDNVYTDTHHYLYQSSQVAKLFSTSNTKAAENEPFYKALNQSLNAMVSMRGQPVTIPSLRKSRRHPKWVLEYPVVVCSSFDRMFAVDFYADSKPEPIKDNFQLEVRYAYVDRNQHQRNDYFLLDFVAFSKLVEFAEAIGNDAKAAVILGSD